jgi:hypothetical protein
MEIERTLFYHIQKELNSEPKALILYGPRQAGKTTLIGQLLAKNNLPSVQLNGDDIRVQELLSRADLDKLKSMVGNHKLLVIDEAQRIENIGLILKLIFNHYKIHILASGSASFDLANKINEPLTGRSTIFTLYPFSYNELPIKSPTISNTERLEEFLRFGMYPKVVNYDSFEEKETHLYDLINNYLYRDILNFENVKKPKKVMDLLTLLALQIGSEVSTAELASHLSMSKISVEKYLDLLEKMFVIVNLRGFSRNLRKEISKTSKYYFVDVGFRNAIIRNFNPLHLRGDAGVLFENFAIIERMKTFHHQRRFANFYFWRTYDQKEIDLIEEKQGQLQAYEFKLKQSDANVKVVKEFTEAYPNSNFQVINQSNFETFLE